jgi:putative endonuclease
MLGRSLEDEGGQIIDDRRVRSIDEIGTRPNPQRDYRLHRPRIALASGLPSNWSMSSDKRFVYVLKNADHNPDFYVGLTSNVKARLLDHNAGHYPHTAARRPWQLHIVMEFSDQPTAVRFERYLKSGSGRSFAKRHVEQ